MTFYLKQLSQKLLMLLSLSAISVNCSSQRPISLNSPTFSEDIFDYLYTNRETLDLCQGEIDHAIAQQKIQTYQIDKNSQLIQFLCFLGAYQGNYQYFFYQETPQKIIIQPLSFEMFQAEKSQGIIKTTVNYVGGLPNYQPQNQSLEITTKYRGLADCGGWGRYQWQESQFKLMEYRLKANCDGQYIEPENYKIVYLDKK